MWQCYDKLETPKIMSAFLIERLPKEEVFKLKFFCPKCKEQLCFISKYSKQKGIVRSHFAHKSNSDCNWIPEGESEKHYNIKFGLLDELLNETIQIKINNLTFDTKTNEIAIEIMVSENSDSIKRKSYDYAKKGYSIATTQDGKTIEVFQTYPQIILDLIKQSSEVLKNQEQIIKSIDSSFLVRANKHGWDCTTCSRAMKSKKHDGFIVCFKDWNNKNRTGNILEKADIVPCERYYPSNKPPILLAEPELEVECNSGDEQ